MKKKIEVKAKILIPDNLGGEGEQEEDNGAGDRYGGLPGRGRHLWAGRPLRHELVPPALRRPLQLRPARGVHVRLPSRADPVPGLARQEQQAQQDGPDSAGKGKHDYRQCCQMPILGDN